MTARFWFWVLLVSDMALLLAGLYLTYAAMVAARVETTVAIGSAILFAFVPVFCVVAAFAARRAWNKGKHGHALATLASPLIFGAYVFVFLRHM